MRAMQNSNQDDVLITEQSKLERVHKCKRCLKFICHNCGQNKQKIIDEEGNRTTEKHRICIKCKDDISNIHQTIQKYQMKWDDNCILTKEWLANLNKVNQKDYEYKHFLNLFHRSGQKFHEQTQIIDKDVIKGRTDFNVFNYSMKQFFYIMQQDVSERHITRLNIVNVLYAVAARFDKVGYCQGMSGLAAFLLCFANQQTSFIIFSDLLQNIFPQNFFERSSYGVSLIGLLAEIYFLKEYYVYYVKNIKNQLLLHQRAAYTDQQLDHTKTVIELFGTKSLLTIFIGVLNFTNLIFIWKEIKQKRTFEVVEKAFLAIVYLNRNNILEQRSFKTLQIYFQNLQLQIFQQAYHDVEINRQLKKQYINDFYEMYEKKWNSSSNSGNIYSLAKITKLTEDEIISLQDYFCCKLTKDQLMTKEIINQSDFLEIIKCYYDVLKQESPEGDPILEISPSFLKKIFHQNLKNNHCGLFFKQFICCFSLCTKGALKDRICAIISTFKDQNNLIDQTNFNKLISSLIQLSPSEAESRKVYFQERVQKYFSNKKINLNQLQKLLSDEYINFLSVYLCNQYPAIINKSIQLFKVRKNI